MNSSKLRRPSIKQYDDGLCCTLRGWLLAWGIFRLLVSSVWTATVTLATVGYIKHGLRNEDEAQETSSYEPQETSFYEPQETSFYEPQETNSSCFCLLASPRLWFDLFALLFQLVEFVMIIIFITAVVKKNVHLCRSYYFYCILTLLMYIIAVVLVSSMSFDGDHYFGEIYITYTIDVLSNTPSYHFYFAAPVVIGLEILLICLIKKLINRYSSRPRRQNV